MIELNEGEIICPKCGGHGDEYTFICTKCLGSGKVDWIENIVGVKHKKYDTWQNVSENQLEGTINSSV